MNVGVGVYELGSVGVGGRVDVWESECGCNSFSGSSSAWRCVCDCTSLLSHLGEFACVFGNIHLEGSPAAEGLNLHDPAPQSRVLGA